MSVGFDSRLHITPVDRFPSTTDEPNGFVVVNGHSAVSYKHRVLVADERTKIAVMSTFKTIKGLIVRNNRADLISSDGLFVFEAKSLEPESKGAFVQRGVVAASNTKSVLLAEQVDGQVNLTAYNHNGEPIPLFAIQGKLRHMSWTPEGFAAIVNNSLFTLSRGSNKLQSSPRDPGLKDAVDMCMVGPSRAIVTFPTMVVLYAHGLRTIIAPMTKPRCYWNDTHLYLFDNASGIVLQIDNLDDVGEEEPNKKHIADLIIKSKAKGSDGDAAYRELSRFIGADKAARLTGRENPCASSPSPGPQLKSRQPG